MPRPLHRLSTHLASELNRLDNAKGAKATDALLNYETVKWVAGIEPAWGLLGCGPGARRACHRLFSHKSVERAAGSGWRRMPLVSDAAPLGFMLQHAPNHRFALTAAPAPLLPPLPALHEGTSTTRPWSAATTQTWAAACLFSFAYHFFLEADLSDFRLPPRRACCACRLLSRTPPPDPAPATLAIIACPLLPAAGHRCLSSGGLPPVRWVHIPTPASAAFLLPPLPAPRESSGQCAVRACHPAPPTQSCPPLSLRLAQPA